MRKIDRILIGASLVAGGAVWWFVLFGPAGDHDKCRALQRDVLALANGGSYRAVFVPGGAGGAQMEVTSEPTPIDKAQLVSLLSKIIDKCGK